MGVGNVPAVKGAGDCNFNEIDEMNMNRFFNISLFAFMQSLMLLCILSCNNKDEQPISQDDIIEDSGITDSNILLICGIVTQDGINIPIELTVNSKITFTSEDMIVTTDGKEAKYALSDIDKFIYKDIANN